MQSSHYPGTEKRLPRHQILRNKRRKPGGYQERTIHQMSPLLQSPATTLTVVGLYHLNHPRWEERTGNMNLDQGLSLQALLEGRGERVQRFHRQTVTQGIYTGTGNLNK